MDADKKLLELEPGSELHLTMLMAPHSLNLVTGEDRAALLAWGADVWKAALAQAARKVEALRDDHCAATGHPLADKYACAPDGVGCDFVTAWNDAAEAIRSSFGSSSGEDR